MPFPVAVPIAISAALCERDTAAQGKDWCSNDGDPASCKHGFSPGAPDRRMLSLDCRFLQRYRGPVLGVRNAWSFNRYGQILPRVTTSGLEPRWSAARPWKRLINDDSDSRQKKRVRAKSARDFAFYAKLGARRGLASLCLGCPIKGQCPEVLLKSADLSLILPVRTDP